MQRYFFDVNTDGAVEHDYIGRPLPGLAEAARTAQSIAEQLACTRPDASSVMEVQIRDVTGGFFYSVPVKVV